jgi:hypothetical protein
MRTFDTCPPEWEKLDADPPLFASAAWLANMADRIDGAHRWFLHTDEPGAEVGLFGAVTADSTVSEAKNPWRLVYEPAGARRLTAGAVAAQSAARSRAAGPEAWFPSLVSTYPGLEAFPIGAGRRSPAALAATLADLVAEARVLGCRSVGFLYVQPEERPFSAALRRAGFLEFPIALRANLTLPGRAFPDYVAALGPQARRELRKIRRTLRTAGVEARSIPLADATDAQLERLVELRMCHRAKYGRRPDEAGERSQLTTLRARFADRCTVHAAVADERIVGFCLYLDTGTVRHAWMTGTDYADPRSRGTYFEVNYYAPIEHAYATGGVELSFSYGAEQIKSTRGARLDEVAGFVLPLDPAELEPARAAVAALRNGLLTPAHAATRRTSRNGPPDAGKEE